MIKLLLALFALVTLVACSTAPHPERAPLPYHVAIVPIAAPRIEQTHGPDNMLLQLDDETLQHLNDEVQGALGGRGFARVSILEPRDPSIDPADAELAAIRAAREETTADLLLTLDLRYGTAIYHEVSFFRAHATPWWMIPGPLFWWAPDHAYTADLTLTVKVFDLARCTLAEADRPLELRRWFFNHGVSLNEVHLDFVDRAGSSWELYPLSFIVPCTALALSHEELEYDLRGLFVEQLAGTLVHELQQMSAVLIRNEQDYSFYLEPSTLVVERLDARRARVRFDMEHRVGRSRNEPAALRVFDGDATRVPELRKLSQAELRAAAQTQTNRPGYVRYSFERLVDVSPKSTTLRLHMAAGGAVVPVREFTLPLPDPPEE